MNGTMESVLRGQLMERRDRLQLHMPIVKDNAPLIQLLKDVDIALEKLDAGSYGLCEACMEPIEKERLLCDPLTRYCIDHLTKAQQQALQQDLELAWSIQRELLPQQDAKIAGWEMSYHFEPAGPVSGDYCDIIPTPDGGFFFALGDVSGKGVAASMLMSHLHAMFRSLTAVGLPFEKLLDRANRVFCESTLPTSFATLVCGIASPSGHLEICNAGHCPGLLVQSGWLTTVDSTALPLGMFCSGSISVQRLKMDPDDSLFLYTDGLSEAENRRSEEFGTHRLSDLVEKSYKLAPRALIESCIRDLTAFMDGALKTDDLALMVLKRRQI